MMDIEERNEKAKNYVLSKLDLVSKLTEEHFQDLLGDENLKSIKSTLEDLINVKAKGFRGVVATAITGKFLDPSFDPLNDFYSCSPRAIFEQGIYDAFKERRIPCGKSDPLNVAKNTSVLNNEWAKGKRPEKAALSVIKYLRFIEDESDNQKKDKIINYFFYKLFEYAKIATSQQISLPKQENVSHQEFANKICDFVLQYPESGTIPQFFIFKLLSKLYENSKTSVKGGDDSVFSTNTTAKKPADIWLEYNGQISNLYEVTVKKVDQKRLDDCLESLNTLNILHKPIHFICRLPEDIETLKNVKETALLHGEKTFNFVDIRKFIQVIFLLLSDEQIRELLEEFREFVNEINRSKTTKDGWNKIFSDN